MIRQFICFICFIACSFGLCQAQSPKDALQQNPLKIAASFYVYDYADVPELTPDPKGYEPFYISHFARHGARYCTKEYGWLNDWLTKASVAGQLTAEGKEFFARYESFYKEVMHCSGNLTEVGKSQHRAMAKHMYERFPKVFKGMTNIEAVSTESPRVIMSMWSFLSGIQSLDATTDIKADASGKYAPWLQPSLPTSPYYVKSLYSFGKATDDAIKEYFENTVPWRAIAEKFFTSADVVEELFKVTPERFIGTVHGVVTGTRCLDKNQGCFDDVFSAEELLQMWKGASAGYFRDIANYEGSQSHVLDYAAFTLGQIIEAADSDIATGDTQLRLRFGHDAGLGPLMACMNVNGYGRQASTFEEGIEIFPSYCVPMGASVQLIFYRSKKSKGDILVKVLVNEQEATLPFEAVDGPYYSWNTLKAYYLPRIEAAKERVCSHCK